jgi:hypothetical protein
MPARPAGRRQLHTDSTKVYTRPHAPQILLTDSSCLDTLISLSSAQATKARRSSPLSSRTNASPLRALSSASSRAR